MTLRELCCRIAGLLRRQDPDADLDVEISSHLELAKARYLHRGMSEAEARRLAALEFGSLATARENVWEQRRMPGIASLVQDLQYAARGVRKSPGFAFVTVATLALGIGLCSLVYSGLGTGILRPLPGVPDPDRLALALAPVPYHWFESYRDQGKTAWTAAAFIPSVPFAVAIEGATPERITGALVSPEYFSTLRVRPMLGRFFDPRIETAGTSPVAVVTEHFWRTRLNADPHAIGRTLRVNGRAVPIVGVGSRDFFGAAPGSFGVPDIFIPATADPSIAPELHDDPLHRTARPEFFVLLRLAPRTTMAAAQARLDVATRALNKGPERRGLSMQLISASALVPLPKAARVALATFYGVLVFTILGLTCANLGGLLLARGAARGREFAIRLSIGAGRARLVRQLLTESAILAAAGGLAGFVAANAISSLVLRTQSASNPLIEIMNPGPDLGAVLFAFAISAVAAAGFGLLPALAVTRLDLMDAMKANFTAGMHRYRRLGLRNAFVVCQMAAATMLVLIMGFFVVGAKYGSRTEPGFDTAPISFFSVDPARDGLTRGESAAVLRSLPERLARLPGVDGVSLAGRPLFGNADPTTPVSVVSVTRPVALEQVGSRFFATLGATVLRGADFENRDLPSGDNSREVVPAAINQAAATELFGDRDPLGRRIRQGDRTFQVSAVVRYAPRAMLMGRPIPTVFVPLTAKDLEHGAAEGTTVVVRARTQVGIAELRRELAAIDSRLTLFHPQTLPEYLAESDRLGSKIAAFYSPVGVFGLLLACLGLAGVTAHTVQRRSKEIGIRMALGAQRSQVLRLVMGEGAVMVAAGTALGFAAATAFVRVLSAGSVQMAQLIGPVASNPALTVGVPAFLVAFAAIACYVPARRAATIDPLAALRED